MNKRNAAVALAAAMLVIASKAPMKMQYAGAEEADDAAHGDHEQTGAQGAGSVAVSEPVSVQPTQAEEPQTIVENTQPVEQSEPAATEAPVAIMRGRWKIRPLTRAKKQLSRPSKRRLTS